jgi:hypothetical protein
MRDMMIKRWLVIISSFVSKTKADLFVNQLNYTATYRKGTGGAGRKLANEATLASAPPVPLRNLYSYNQLTIFFRSTGATIQ